MCEDFDYESLIQDNINDCTEEKLHLYFGKKKRRENKTTYTFYETLTDEKVRKSLLSFFRSNLEKLKNDNITNNPNEDSPEAYCTVNLEGIDVWNQFESCIYSDANISKFKDIDDNQIQKNKKQVQQVNTLKEIKSNLNHYLLINECENCILGQISRIKSSKVLYGKKWIFFEREKFTEMKEDENIELEERDSILFFINKQYKLGFINNLDEYDEIFDMNQQYVNNAIKVINESEFSNCCNIDVVERIVRSDRNIQRMLNRPLTANSFKKFDLNDVNDSFETFSTFDVEKAYDVNFDNNEFIIDRNNEKESLKNIIKFIGGYYNQSLNGKYLIEGNPKHIINNANND